MILVPTLREQRKLATCGASLGGAFLCGFGPVAAAARTASLLAAHRPERVFLVGIAGTYDATRLPIGHATAFSEVAIDGIGAGEGAQFLGPGEIGLPQWDGEGTDDGDPIFQRLALTASADAPRLLTVCAASATADHARQRVARYAGVMAEDMEGFAVALACALTRTPLTIVRGIANLAGDRTVANWRVADALAAAARLVNELRG